jgi:hypothetical protein
VYKYRILLEVSVAQRLAVSASRRVVISSGSRTGMCYQMRCAEMLSRLGQRVSTGSSVIGNSKEEVESFAQK